MRPGASGSRERENYRIRDYLQSPLIAQTSESQAGYNLPFCSQVLAFAHG